jgi:uncharacterized membrane protein YfcA
MRICSIVQFRGIFAMTDSFLLHVLTIALIFFCAGIVKGITGMGLPTIAMGLLGTMMLPVEAAALLILPSFVTNVLQLFTGPSFLALLSRLRFMMLGIAVGTLGGVTLMKNGSAGWAVMGLGGVLVLYGGAGLLAWQASVPARIEKGLSPCIGLATGLITGCTGVFVIPAVPYIQALGLKKEELIQALGLSFTVSTIALAVGLAWTGVFHIDNTTTSATAVVPALLGMWFGQRVRQLISQQTFRQWFFICLILLGLHLVLQSIL